MRNVQILSVAEALADEQVRAYWESSLDPQHTLSMYQSMEWAAHVAACPDTETGPPGVACLRGADGSILALVLYELYDATLAFEAGPLLLHRARRTTASILGNKPLASDPRAIDQLFAGMFDAIPGLECIRIDKVKAGGPVVDLLSRCAELAKRTITYMPKTFALRGKLHETMLGSSFEELLTAQLKPKHRSNLRRDLKELKKASGGEIELACFDRPGDGARFFTAAAPVAAASWQVQLGTEFGPDLRTRLDDLSHRGLLRSFVLRVRGEPCAYAIGYQWRSEYHYIRIGHDPKFNQLSPGTLLLYILLEKLHSDGRTKVMNLGVGDFDYKFKWGNVHSEISDVWLLRRTLANQGLVATHGRFRDVVVKARDWRSVQAEQLAKGEAVPWLGYLTKRSRRISALFKPA